MKNEPFYASGLKFSCMRCSACCCYDAGYVYLSYNDLDKLIIKMGMEKNSFIAEYCRWVEDYKGRQVLSLKEKPNKDCVFWDNGCSVYAVRPLQCWMFPFWDHIVSSEHNWKIAATGCPGMNLGELHSKEKIESFIKMSKFESLILRGGGA